MGTAVVISGANLGGSGSVTIGGISAAAGAWSATSVTCTVPAGLAVGAKNVVVTPAGGAASNARTFTVTVTPAPTAAITGLTPNHAQAGASIVIAGSNLGSGGSVRFGATVATTTAWSASSVTAVVPASLQPGVTTVTVTPTGGAASNGRTFTVDAPPAPADVTAPVTTAAGVTGGAWYRSAVTVALTAADNAGGSGVASITYAVDGGAPVLVAGAAASVPVSVSGAHSVTYFATDGAGNTEATRTLAVNIDTSKPRTRAPRAARVRRAHQAWLRYEVRDLTPNGGSARVVIAIKNSRGKVVKRLRLGERPVNTALTARFTCTLRPGAYRFLVRATDAAGNTQANIAAQTLRVVAGG